ncbi:MAG: hypothetical protein OXR73_23185 [Myxococcales bacterium]|nr:hypothetical protein [Myxococcales bacterium]
MKQALARPWLLMVTSLLCSCAESIPPTEVIIQLQAEPTVRSTVERVHVRLLSGSDGETRTERLDRDFEGSELSWPVRLLVTPIGRDATRTYEIVASAYDGASEVARVRAISGFVDGQTRYLNLHFKADCRDVLCSAGQTCEGAVCVSAGVNAIALEKVGPRDTTTIPGVGTGTLWAPDAPGKELMWDEDRWQ